MDPLKSIFLFSWCFYLASANDLRSEGVKNFTQSDLASANDLRSEGVKNFTQSGEILGGSATLSIEIENMKRPAVWYCGNKRYECDRSCANGTEFQVSQSGNKSSLWMRRITNKCLTWKFLDDNVEGGIFHLKINNSTRIEIYKMTQNAPVVLGKNVTIHIESSLIGTPVLWVNEFNYLQCVDTCENKGNYEVHYKGNSSTLLIHNVTEQDLTWSFCDYYFCSESYTLVMKADGSGTSIPTYAKVLIAVLCLVAILIISCIIFKYPPYIWIKTHVNEWISCNEYQLPPDEV
ncbi:XP_036355964.1uncharacterized protein LOC115231405 [Octopus vulgaris]|uniref:XP_036355964.1uncharacterized protein LOC115231405 n=2 Tax=Octopus vulgaris TaxID=6645 RepID=A0AA36FN57_OCTVU|nr:XP_036355964.1uncharacterized protein LOC115231405 [Octopus vulgaris]